jgi:subtilisin family serine protease
MNFSKQPPPFEGRTGKGVRVAIIDSGVNVRHPHIVGVAGGASVPVTGEIEEGSYLDILGHGTAVTAAIQEKAPGAEYLAVKLFHDGLRTTTEALLRAIAWAIDQEVDLINLSLGTRENRFAGRFEEVVENGLRRGVTLISALDADGERCFPGCLPGVLGVGLDWECDRDGYRCTDGPVFYASGYPRSLPGVAPARNLHGISFAVANMTGIIARACENLSDRSPRAISDVLIAESVRVNAPAAQ